MQNFNHIINQMRLLGMKLPEEKVRISIPEAPNALKSMFGQFLQLEGKHLQWLSEYDEVADWLSDNKGRGLFMYGNCGRGKSYLGRYVLPAILYKYCNRVVSVFDIQDMNKNPNLVLSKHLISLDDIGTEEAINQYGNKRMAFAEIMDAAEKNGKLLIISTNLQANEIKLRYGDRILDRILSTTQRVVFNGKSLRA